MKHQLNVQFSEQSQTYTLCNQHHREDTEHFSLLLPWGPHPPLQSLFSPGPALATTAPISPTQAIELSALELQINGIMHSVLLMSDFFC